MNDRREGRTKTRVVRRLLECHSCEDDETESSQSDHNNGSPPTVRRTRCGGGGYCSDSATYSPHRLPPIGVFWDIENCQIPRGKSAVAVAQVIRDNFLRGYHEAEFMVVCDVKKEPSQVIEELNDAHVNLIHVGSQYKNAADDKLKQSIRRFADFHGSSAAIVLISGDINFAPDLCDLRNRKKIHVILVHNDMCSESLILCANEHYRFSALVAGLPLRGAVKGINQAAEVTVSGLPLRSEPGKVRGRLRRLAENCGGRVGLVVGQMATVRFPSMEFAMRAQKRMDGENVFGSQINVTYPITVPDLSPAKNVNRRTYIRREEEDKCFEDQRSPSQTITQCPIDPTKRPVNGRLKQLFPVPFYNQENVPHHVNSKFSEPLWNNLQNNQLPNGRPILGRQNRSNFSYEQKTIKGCTNGRHSLDSMLDFDVEEKQSHATFDHWLENTQERRKSYTPALQINTSLPPPPIIDFPSKESKYFFHPIQTSTNFTNGGQESSPSPSSSNDNSEVLRCLLHSQPQQVDCSLMNVTKRLSDFSARLMALVTSHENRLPLASLKDCYEAQFDTLCASPNAQGVPIEHLVTCACSIELVKRANGKYLRLASNVSPTFSDSPLEGPLATFAEEVKKLLKNQPKCQIAFDRFTPAYCNAYGRNCRMSDYGCTKLVQLLDKIANVVQVMGEGRDRIITLTHRVQIQQFTADLTHVLQLQANKQLELRELPQHWISGLGCTLEPTQYGLCYVEDLLGLVPSKNISFKEGIISLVHNQRQTTAEIGRLKQFALQVVELLSTTPHFSMEFSKFLSAFQQHFRVQCKVSDYGFDKLIDLLRAIPHVVKVEGVMETGRRVSLTDAESLKVLSNQILFLVQPRSPPGLYVDALYSAYLWQYGTALKPAFFKSKSLVELINKLPSLKVVTNSEGLAIIAQNNDPPKNEKSEIQLQKHLNQSQVKVNGVKSECFQPKQLDVHVPCAKEAAIPLLTPAEFLQSPSKTCAALNLLPCPPDPSMLPKPDGLILKKINNGVGIGDKSLEDVQSNEENSRRHHKLAPQFCTPLH